MINILAHLIQYKCQNIYIQRDFIQINQISYRKKTANI